VVRELVEPLGREFQPLSEIFRLSNPLGASKSASRTFDFFRLFKSREPVDRKFPHRGGSHPCKEAGAQRKGDLWRETL
jgi:hypothetical protein